jgi:hypothetical protein
MGEDIALAGKIDAKHRAWQHLRHRSFHYDLLLFRHLQSYSQMMRLSTGEQ